MLPTPRTVTTSSVGGDLTYKIMKGLKACLGNKLRGIYKYDLLTKSSANTSRPTTPGCRSLPGSP